VQQQGADGRTGGVAATKGSKLKPTKGAAKLPLKCSTQSLQLLSIVGARHKFINWKDEGTASDTRFTPRSTLGKH